MKKYHKPVIVVLFIMLTSSVIQAGTGDGHIDPGENELSELAKSVQNPLADILILSIQNNTNFNFGPQEKTQNVLNIQPVYPVNLNDDWNLLTRTIVPVISQPGLVPGQERKNGIGDVQFSALFAPVETTSGGWLWGAGVITQLDTATNDRLGSGKWGLGPTALALKIADEWVYGALVNNIWDVAGDDDRADLNQMLIQPFINYNFPNKPGRYLTFSPIITANWEASSGNKWTLPLGLGIGQIVKLGEVPVNLQASAYYNVEKPQFASDWQLRLQVSFLLPK